MRTSQVMELIPENASFIFEFNNDKGFYDIFKDNKLFAPVIGQNQLDELNAVYLLLVKNPLTENFFASQNIFISVHPSKHSYADLLITLSCGTGFNPSVLEQLSKLAGSGLVVTPIRITGRQGYNIYINSLKKRFFILNNENNIYSCSFSKDLIDQTLKSRSDREKINFTLLSEQQSANSLASLYVNYQNINELLTPILQNKNTDIFKSLLSFPATAAMSLNYRGDALMFNGKTVATKNMAGYLEIFAGQQPVQNHLKDIFPSTTAYSASFGVSDISKFASDLSIFNDKTVPGNERNRTFNKIKAETGINIKKEFNNLLDTEFAIVNTRFFEKFAIVSVKNGSKLKTILSSISTMNDDKSGQFNYEKLPVYLLGEPFSVFKRPYFIIIDNYLILSNSINELNSYADIYLNRKFLNKNDQYNQFDNLLAARSNVSFLLNLKNAQPILERNFNPDFYNYIGTKPGWSDFYAISVQLTATDKSFYTNVCLKLNSDTTLKNK